MKFFIIWKNFIWFHCLRMSCASSQSAEDLPEKASMKIPDKAKEEELTEKRKEELPENPKGEMPEKPKAEMHEKPKEEMKKEPPEKDGTGVVCAKIRYCWEDDNLVVIHKCLICCYISHEYDDFINHIESEHILLLHAMSTEESTASDCDKNGKIRKYCQTENIVLEETIDTTPCATCPACQNMDDEKVFEREVNRNFSQSQAVVLLFNSIKD